ncbi:MAG: hypothetical protein SFV54_28760 [Bryobacteraceae bacterium]|nr:hypothetical protein [Bryobacteraceae bacterium]
MRTKRVEEYLLSLPERVLRSGSALGAGLLREVGEAALPAPVRRTRIYQSMVETTLRFLIEQVGQVEGAYPPEGQLAQDFLLRRTAGNGIELIGILAFHASPVWVLAGFADLSGAGRALLPEIAATLEREGLLAHQTAPLQSMDQLLDALERTAGRAAEAVNTPPLNVAQLRDQWTALRREFQRAPELERPKPGDIAGLWSALSQTAAAQNRGVFELSSAMALSALQVTGRKVWTSLLDHYAATLQDIRTTGYAAWWLREFRPYLHAAAQQFSPKRISATQRLLGRK